MSKHPGISRRTLLRRSVQGAIATPVVVGTAGVMCGMTGLAMIRSWLHRVHQRLDQPIARGLGG